MADIKDDKNQETKKENQQFKFELNLSNISVLFLVISIYKFGSYSIRGESNE